MYSFYQISIIFPFLSTIFFLNSFYFLDFDFLIYFSYSSSSSSYSISLFSDSFSKVKKSSFYLCLDPAYLYLGIIFFFSFY
mmetsp:Transcript_16986/g.1522  ORF Transcript_16986/g.1522 Transcript_16986/m.1522 type:complete len:81 (-) Transcript_16986:3-245(-)